MVTREAVLPVTAAVAVAVTSAAGKGEKTPTAAASVTGGGGGGSSFVIASASARTLSGGNGTAAGNNASADYRSGVGAGTAGTVNYVDPATGGDGEVFLRYAVTITSFDYTGNGLSGNASAPINGNFSTGFYYTLTTGNTVSPLTFSGASAYTATDNLTNAVTTTGLTFTNTGAITLVRGGSGTSNLLTLVTNTSISAAPTIALNNTGAATVNLDLALNASTTVSGAGSATFNGVLSGTGGLGKSGSGILTLSSANGYTGGTTISGGTLQLGDGTSSNGSVAGNIVDNAALVFANPNAQTYGGVLSGTGTLTKTGAGNLTLSGANTYSGGTTISAGTVAVGSNTALGSGAVTINGGTLAAVAASTLTNAVTLGDTAGLSSGTVSNGGNVHNAGLTLAGAVTLSPSLNSTNLTVTGASRVAITGAIGEASGQPTVLVKRGAGTLELDHDDTYSGGTLVAAGTLVVNNNYVAGGFTSGAGGSGAGQGAVTVANGATLTGAYVISGPVQVNSGGTLAVGNSIGVGSVGALTLAGGSTIDFELGTDGVTSDRVDVASLLSRSGTGGIDFDLTGGASRRRHDQPDLGGHVHAADLRRVQRTDGGRLLCHRPANRLDGYLHVHQRQRERKRLPPRQPPRHRRSRRPRTHDRVASPARCDEPDRDGGAVAEGHAMPVNRFIGSAASAALAATLTFLLLSRAAAPARAQQTTSVGSLYLSNGAELDFGLFGANGGAGTNGGNSDRIASSSQFNYSSSSAGNYIVGFSHGDGSPLLPGSLYTLVTFASTNFLPTDATHFTVAPRGSVSSITGNFILNPGTGSAGTGGGILQFQLTDESDLPETQYGNADTARFRVYWQRPREVPPPRPVRRHALKGRVNTGSRSQDEQNLPQACDSLRDTDTVIYLPGRALSAPSILCRDLRSAVTMRSFLRDAACPPATLKTKYKQDFRLRLLARARTGNG